MKRGEPGSNVCRGGAPRITNYPASWKPLARRGRLEAVTAHRLAARQTGELDGMVRGLDHGPGTRLFNQVTIARIHVYLRRVDMQASAQRSWTTQQGQKFRPGLAGSEGLSRYPAGNGSASPARRVWAMWISRQGVGRPPPWCVQTHSQPQLSKELHLIPNSLGCLERPVSDHTLTFVPHSVEK